MCVVPCTSSLILTIYPLLFNRSIRIGVHSGPVTAGVLRGERSRFQLFGNTMNTAARLEHTGKMNRIHLSEATAELLRAAGKEHWLRLREDLVEAKGLGKMCTYWANVSSSGSSRGSREAYGAGPMPASSDISRHNEVGNVTGANFHLRENVNTLMSEKTSRLINWNVEILRFCMKSRRSLPCPSSTQLLPSVSMSMIWSCSTLPSKISSRIISPVWR
jgi:Adenylate and Guanylate cyclase catalytic domain